MFLLIALFDDDTFDDDDNDDDDDDDDDDIVDDYIHDDDNDDDDLLLGLHAVNEANASKFRLHEISQRVNKWNNAAHFNMGIRNNYAPDADEVVDIACL